MKWFGSHHTLEPKGSISHKEKIKLSPDVLVWFKKKKVLKKNREVAIQPLA